MTDWRSRKGWAQATITSNAKSAVWFFCIFAVVWNAISLPIAFIVPAVASCCLFVSTCQRIEIHLRFPMFRNKMLTVFAAIFAGGFGFTRGHSNYLSAIEQLKRQY